MNNLFGLIFFVTLVIAGLSSGISIIEAMSSSLIDKFNLARGRTVSALCLSGFLGSNLFTTQGGLYLLDIVDHFLNQYGLVLAGMLECLIVGWVMRARVLRHHINAISKWKVWVAAYGQIFFTLSLGFGIMVTYASYLPRRSDLVQNAVITSVTNCIYSFLAGFAVFSVLGYMAQQKGVPIDQVVKSGPSLAFVVYPEAI